MTMVDNGPSGPAVSCAHMPRESASWWIPFRSTFSDVGAGRRSIDGSELKLLPPVLSDMGFAHSSPDLSYSNRPSWRDAWPQGAAASRRRGSVGDPREEQLSRPILHSSSRGYNAPEEGLTVARQEWIQLVAKFEIEETPEVPLVPRWSEQVSINREAYFQGGSDTLLIRSASSGLTDNLDGKMTSSPCSTGPFVCATCSGRAAMERVEVQMLVEDGRVRLRIDVVCLHRRRSVRLLPSCSSGLLTEPFGRHKRPHAFSWILQCFSICWQPLVRS